AAHDDSRQHDSAIRYDRDLENGTDMNRVAVKPRLRRKAEALGEFSPYYSTELGAAYVTDSLEALRKLPSGSINLIVTSPPYALHFKKAYGNVHKDEYVDWFLNFAREMHRVLADDG